jgi:hypothetical protein
MRGLAKTSSLINETPPAASGEFLRARSSETYEHGRTCFSKIRA